MKAPDILYECPHTLVEALDLLSDNSVPGQPLAGGQSLMPMMNLRMARPERLVDLNGLSELDFVSMADNEIHIGAMVRYTSLLNSALIREHLPLLPIALPHIAHQAVRNRGTIGGSAALADPAAEVPALLKALDGRIVAVSKRGQREIVADDFFQGIYETALEEDELIHSVKIPAAVNRQKFGFYELARRHGDYAMAGVAIKADSVNPFQGLRIVFFGVADMALRATAAEAVLEGTEKADDTALHNAQRALPAELFNGDVGMSIETRLQLARVVLKRALRAMQ